MSTKPIPLARRRLVLALISLLTLLPTTIYLQNRTPHCPPSLILTAPSHGYHWYTISLHTTKNPPLTIYPNTSTTPKSAISTLSNFRNHSIVVLPPLNATARTVVKLAIEKNIPVVVLRREVSGAYREFLERGGAMKWENWEKWIDDYFGNVARLLKENRVIADWLWFDNVVWRDVVWLHRNGCHVRNFRVR